MKWIILIIVVHSAISLGFKAYELHERRKMDRFILEVMERVQNRNCDILSRLERR